MIIYLCSIFTVDKMSVQTFFFDGLTLIGHSSTYLLNYLLTQTLVKLHKQNWPIVGSSFSDHPRNGGLWWAKVKVKAPFIYVADCGALARIEVKLIDYRK
jgi:hypothetical protein